MAVVRFDEIGVLPEPGDNVAIASRRLEAGTVVDFGGTSATLPHTVLEGHRFVTQPVAPGEALLSWSTPFARALRELRIGDYVCTPSSLAAVSARGVDGLPAEASARNEPLVPYKLDETALRLGEQVPGVEQPGTFVRVANVLTLEFLVDVDDPSCYYFIEGNPRLQVEHGSDGQGQSGGKRRAHLLHDQCPLPRSGFERSYFVSSS